MEFLFVQPLRERSGLCERSYLSSTISGTFTLDDLYYKYNIVKLYRAYLLELLRRGTLTL